MPPFLKYMLGRFLFSLVTLCLLTLVLYGAICLAPIDVRVSLYMPSNTPLHILMDNQAYARLKQLVIVRNHLDDPFIIQYGIWVKNFFTNNWGWSQTLHQDVLPALISRIPATIELTVYSLLLIIPLTLLSGLYAAVNKDKPLDFIIRSASTFASAIPLFIMAFFLITIFYINLKWATLNSTNLSTQTINGNFHFITGLVTIDGLLNGRMDVTLNAFQRLALPVLTITASQWALLTRITRSSTIEEIQKEYVIAVKSRGASIRMILWRHVFKNTLSVFLANTALSAASIVTGVFIVERIFLWPGVSDLLFRSGTFVPDAPLVLGFTIYTVVVVLVIMFMLDIVQALTNPLVSQEVLGGSDVN